LAISTRRFMPPDSVMIFCPLVPQREVGEHPFDQRIVRGLPNSPREKRTVFITVSKGSR
jgi:hypothetical protein